MSSNHINVDDDASNPDRWFEQNTITYPGNTSPILLVTIVSFGVIIIIVFAYHLYERFVLRRRRPSFFQDLSVDSQPHKGGLDAHTIASLPTFVVGVNVVDEVAKECAVCLSLFEKKETARMLPECKHVFHVTCVDTWLATHSTCPVCRTKVEPSPSRLEPEPREGPVGDGAPLDVVAVEVAADNKTGGSSIRLCG